MLSIGLTVSVQKKRKNNGRILWRGTRAGTIDALTQKEGEIVNGKYVPL